MLDVLRSPYPVQAVRPMHHWWLCPRVLAWFRVLMIMSLVKPPASAGPLSRIGDYLFAARGPGLFPWCRRRTTFPYERTVTRGPPYPLFHRRCKRLLGARPGTDARLPSPGPHGVWAGCTRRRRGSRCPRVARVCVVLDALCLGCLLSWMPFVLDALCLGCWSSWVSWDPAMRVVY